MMAIENSPVHGTAVAVGGRGFLILGDSGAGKSGLALKMMALGAELVSDDQVLLHAEGADIVMSAPKALHGKIEARFIGILSVKACAKVALHHVIDLTTKAEARLPQLRTCDVLGARIDLINGQNVPNLAPILMTLGRGTRHS